MQAHSLAEMLEWTVRRYRNCALEAAQVIEELIGLARELVGTARNNLTIAWTRRKNVRANLRRPVKRILRMRRYPLDKQEAETRTVLKQAELRATNVSWGEDCDRSSH